MVFTLKFSNPSLCSSGSRKNIAAPPDCFHIAIAFQIRHFLVAGKSHRRLNGLFDLFAQLADEHVNDLQLRFVHATIKVVEEHFLGQCRAFAQRQQLKHLVFLAGEMNGLSVDLHGLGVKIDRQQAGIERWIANDLLNDGQWR